MKRCDWITLVIAISIFAMGLVLACGDDDDDDSDDDGGEEAADDDSVDGDDDNQEGDVYENCIEFFLDCYGATLQEAEQSCSTFEEPENECFEESYAAYVSCLAEVVDCVFPGDTEKAAEECYETMVEGLIECWSSGDDDDDDCSGEAELTWFVTDCSELEDEYGNPMTLDDVLDECNICIGVCSFSYPGDCSGAILCVCDNCIDCNA